MTTLAPPVNHASRSPRALSVAAILTACAILPLVFVGAGVTSTDSGMAYKDWPTSAGHLVNPPSWWQADDTRWEHGHRLLGAHQDPARPVWQANNLRAWASDIVTCGPSHILDALE
ncbi:MAG: hypothetical protein IIC51_03210 [Planctomycetes bacterium]|nr:hypothetical protein [Planctomycetota bacterium]